MERKTKLVSQLNDEGYFVSGVLAHESPMDPGEFHIPGGAQDIDPPLAIPVGKRAKFVEGEWEYEDIPEPVVEEVAVEIPEVEAKTAEESTDDKRKRLLAESDYVVIRAYEQGTKVPREWIIYRQMLRDIPEQKGFPDLIAWPIKPQE